MFYSHYFDVLQLIKDNVYHNFKDKFTNIGNEKLLRIQLSQRKLMENETLN